MTAVSRWRKPSRRIVAIAAVASLAFAMTWFAGKGGGARVAENTELSSQSKKQNRPFTPSDAQWATLTIETVTRQVFRAGRITEGKIAVDEDRATPIFSPY